MAKQKTESALIKKVGDIANVMSSAGVGYTDYITQASVKTSTSSGWISPRRASAP